MRALSKVNGIFAKIAVERVVDPVEEILQLLDHHKIDIVEHVPRREKCPRREPSSACCPWSRKATPPSALFVH